MQDVPFLHTISPTTFSIFLQHLIPKLSRQFWSTFRRIQFSVPHKAMPEIWHCEVPYFDTIKLNVYSVWHDCMFILLLLYYWLLISASKCHHHANICKIFKILVYILQKPQFYGIPFTFISSLYSYYQPLDVLFVVSWVEILYCEYYGCKWRLRPTRCSKLDLLIIN
jgi:hypothetical protein